MSRALRGACAGLMLAVVVGCTFDELLTPSYQTFTPHTVVPGTVEKVSARLEEGLADAGITTIAKRLDTEVRLAGRIKSGKIFCLHLYGKRVGKDDRTLVSIQWDSGTDEAFWQTVLRILDAPPKEAAEATANVEEEEDAPRAER